MSTSLLKTNEHHVPVTGLVALTQTALGFGAGLLLAGRMGKVAKNITAITVLSVGVVSTLPLVMEAVSYFANKPGGEREMRKRLGSIRRDSGVSQDVDLF
ncbi:MAG TPA: hypothetical protein VG733_11985 [Chthoniobacteraceae bacterium]|nr:hypothetical protein [Chthoniobacteraceae bacterium]